MVQNVLTITLPYQYIQCLYTFILIPINYKIWSSPLLQTKFTSYEGHLENKERFAIQRYLLIIGKKNNMQVL